MKATKQGNHTRAVSRLAVTLAGAFVVGGFLFGPGSARAQPGPVVGSGGVTNIPLDSWSFYDPTNWTSDLGYPPISFTNLAYSHLGNFQSLVVDTNLPAWLQINAYESDGTTNLTVENGTVTFWFAPDWSGTDQGGTGPGEYARLFEVGAYTTDSSYGWWSLYVDPAGTNLYFSAQTNDLSSTITTYLSVPISWTTNYFHFLVLTYSPTNSALYLDGVLATNGPGVTIYPGPEALANGFCIGSDTSGVYQAHGLFDTVATYNYPLNSNDVQLNFQAEYMYIGINPWNMAMWALMSAPSSPSYACRMTSRPARRAPSRSRHRRRPPSDRSALRCSRPSAEPTASSRGAAAGRLLGERDDDRELARLRQQRAVGAPRSCRPRRRSHRGSTPCASSPGTAPADPARRARRSAARRRSRKCTVRSTVGTADHSCMRMYGAGISASLKNASDSASIGRGSTSPIQRANRHRPPLARQRPPLDARLQHYVARELRSVLHQFQPLA